MNNLKIEEEEEELWFGICTECGRNCEDDDFCEYTNYDHDEE